MNDTTLGYAVIALGILAVLLLVFVLASRGGQRAEPAHPPRGVHLPAPSLLPVLFAIAATLIGAGVAFAPDGQLANWFLLVPGLVLLIASVLGWVRAAGDEWHDVERRPHDDLAGH